MGRREADRTFGADGLRLFTPWMGRCEASGTVEPAAWIRPGESALNLRENGSLSRRKAGTRNEKGRRKGWDEKGGGEKGQWGERAAGEK